MQNQPPSGRPEAVAAQPLAITAHELRTPLTSIRAFAEILRATPGLPAAEQQRFLTIIIEESDRLARLIDSLLEAGRPDTPGRDGADSADLVGAIRETVEMLGPQWRSKAIQVTLDVPEGELRVAATGDELKQVLVNLLGNAIKFLPGTGGVLKVGAGGTAISALVSIADNGPGVAPGDRLRIFEPFVMGSAVERGTSDVEAGSSGLGLSISRRIVEQRGGRLWVESNPGDGACFRFTIPRIPSDNDLGKDMAINDPGGGDEH